MSHASLGETMRRIFAVLCVLSLLMVGGHGVCAAETSLQDMKAWVGKYPADEINGKTIWDNDAFKAKVHVFIGPKTQDFIFNKIGREVATPVEIKNDVLQFFVCKAHACPDAAARIFVDLKKDAVHVCWTILGEKDDLWLSAKADPKPLSEGACLVTDGFDLFDKYGKE